jgi:hypothetical protein
MRKINEGHLYKAVNRVLAYRILDVSQWVKKNEPSLHSTVAPPLVEPHNDLLRKLVGTDTLTPCP